MLEADFIRVLHMIDACGKAIEFIENKSMSDLESDKLLQFAVVRAIEIVGEAASRVTSETRSQHPEVPWLAIVGMRNRLIHAYFDINTVILWHALTQEIPDLLIKLEIIIGPVKD